MEGLRVADSFTVMNEIVLPNDTNTFGNLMGGRLMYWMDIAAAIVAGKHCKGPSMTASVDNISFKTPIKIGNLVHVEAKLTRAFNTSMEINIRVWGQDYNHQYESNEAFFTFVCLGADGKPKPVPPVIPETKEEQVLYESALRRRQVRLILGGKMKPSEAEELKALFMSQTPAS